MPIIVKEKPEPCTGHKEIDEHLKAIYELMTDLFGTVYETEILNLFQDFEYGYDELVDDAINANNHSTDSRWYTLPVINV